MPEPTRIDPERLAALIDGRLGEAESAALRAELANVDADTLAAYADATALARELQDADAPAVVRPVDSTRFTRRWVVPGMTLAAAALVGIALFQTSRARSSGTDVTAGLTTHALDVPQWSTVRSGDAPVSERGRAVRLGILLVQYELASRARDTAAASRAALIAEMLDDIPGGSAAAARWRIIADGSQLPTMVARDDDARVVRSLVDSDFVRLGSWLEAARTAANDRQWSWFDIHEPPVIAHAALAEVERLRKTHPLDLQALTAAVAETERELAR